MTELHTVRKHPIKHYFITFVVAYYFNIQGAKSDFQLEDLHLIRRVTLLFETQNLGNRSTIIFIAAHESFICQTFLGCLYKLFS